MFYSRLSLHSLLHNRRQYISLFLVCLVGTGIMIACQVLTDGMLSAVREKSRQYYGGDLQFIGGYDEHVGTTNAQELIQKIKPLFPNGVQFFERFDYDADDTSFYYEGERTRLRMLKGVDFENEKDVFKDFTFVQGGAISLPEHNSILISAPIATKLGIHAGDEITLQVVTDGGYKNTMTLVVTGIFQDSSLFGMYTSYLDKAALCIVTAYPEQYTNRISIYYGKIPAPTPRDVKQLQHELEGIYTMYPQTDDKHDFFDELRREGSPRPQYALITLDANIIELKLLIEAIRSVVMLVVVVLLAIIAVGIGSTYRVIVMKRITEIGTYRALGMEPGGVRNLFLTETFYLLLSGFMAGTVLSLLISFVMSRFDFSFIPAFDLFLINGHIRPVYGFAKTMSLFFVMLVTTLLSVLFTIRNVVHISPVGALATTN